MSAEVIKEFLVSLGFKVDANGQRRFTDGVKEASKQVAALGAAAVATAAAIAIAVTKMASELEDLYYVSQRTKASAENIKSLGFAASQMGSSAAASTASLEQLAKFLRTNPGGESLLKSWGVETRETNGQLRDTTDVLKDLGGLFRSMPYAQAYARANVLGIDEKTLMAIIQGTDEFSERYKQILRRYGLDTEKATKLSHDFMVQLRDLKAEGEVLGTVVGTKLIGLLFELEHRWEAVDDDTKANTITFAKWAAGIAAGALVIASGPIGWIGALGVAILALWDDYEVWKEGGKSLIDWDNWKPGIDAAITGLRALTDALKETFGWVEKVSDKVLGGTKAGDAIGNVAAHVAAFFGSKDAQASIDRTNWSGLTTEQRAARVAQWKSMTAEQQRGQKLSDENVRLLGGYKDGAPAAGAGGGNVPIGIRNNNPGNLRTGPGGSFGSYDTPEEGLGALKRQLDLYFNGQSAAAGKRKLQSVRDIISTYAPSNENNTDAYIGDISSKLGVSPDQALNLNDPSQMAQLMKGIVQHENGMNPYSAEMFQSAAGGGAATASGGPPSLVQTTNVTVLGTSNPQENAAAIADAQNGVNQRLTRNFATAIQ